MQTEEFINRVEQAGINDRTVATNVSFATIEALCLHLPQEEIRQMTSQLPSELSQAALKGGQQQSGDAQGTVELDQFYSEVATRSNMDAADVREPVRVVINTFKKAVTTGEFVDVTFELPDDINTLLAS
ncbi:hypothetical protein SADO_07642 [Salinisphaera dokdonensis CL-ES53]|uniref:DUF2267 domain-containing protein n=1 Tax=Salinisphaera dokdonensis CL-ES53 TaxID=1304272 RepID=A0ABV2AZP6_9GAMM